MAIVYALLCVIAWSCIPVVAKWAQVDGAFDNYQLLFWSNLLSSAVVAPLGFWGDKVQQSKVGIRSVLFTAFLGFLGCCFYYLCLYYGYAHAKGMDVLAVQYTWPSTMAILGVVVLGEKIRTKKILGVGFGFAATMMVISKGEFETLSLERPVVLVIVFLGATSFALFSVLSKKDTAFSPGVTVSGYFFSATIFSFVALCWQSVVRLPPPEVWLSLGINGVFLNGLSYLLWIKALSLEDASRIAPLVYGAPVLSVVWLMLFCGEPFYWAYAIGIGCIVVSGVMLVEDEKHAELNREL